MKKFDLEKFVKDNIVFQEDARFCSENCMYKHNEYCDLFCQTTGYNFRLDKPKRVDNCLKLFKEGK